MPSLCILRLSFAVRSALNFPPSLSGIFEVLAMEITYRDRGSIDVFFLRGRLKRWTERMESHSEKLRGTQRKYQRHQTIHRSIAKCSLQSFDEQTELQWNRLHRLHGTVLIITWGCSNLTRISNFGGNTTHRRILLYKMAMCQ